MEQSILKLSLSRAKSTLVWRTTRCRRWFDVRSFHWKLKRNKSKKKKSESIFLYFFSLSLVAFPLATESRCLSKTNNENHKKHTHIFSQLWEKSNVNKPLCAEKVCRPVTRSRPAACRLNIYCFDAGRAEPVEDGAAAAAAAEASDDEMAPDASGAFDLDDVLDRLLDARCGARRAKRWRARADSPTDGGAARRCGARRTRHSRAKCVSRALPSWSMARATPSRRA